MAEFMNVLEPYLLELIIAILTAIATYIGAKVKKIYEDKVNTETKRNIVEHTVQYVEQVYKDLHGEEKLNKAKEKSLEWLSEKGVTISEVELEVMIESIVNGINNKK